LLALMASIASLAAAQAKASGQVPPTPIEDRNMASVAACKAFLEATWRNDLRKANP
jgi:hypothetical protein